MNKSTSPHINIRSYALAALFIYLFFSKLNAQVSHENLIKAVYIEKFTRFIEWPEKFNIDDTLEPFYIGVFGKSAMNNTLQKVYKDLKIRDKHVTIENIEDLQDLKKKGNKYHILFVPETSDKWLDEIVLFSIKNNILTIGDGENFALHGVHINFIIQEDRVQYEINESTVYKSNIFMSYRLLNSARIVSSKK